MVKHFLAGLLLCGCMVQLSKAQLPPKREMRAVWIATIENIDWPSRKGLSSEEQQQEFIRLLDQHQRNGMNTIVFQVRPVSDAFYASPFEPWSEYLTGVQGKPPYPYYDPLEFMVTETHKRGMEFHAWFNPYRAVANIRSSSIAPNHITRLKPQWFVTYGDKKYFDPGIPEVRSYVTEVIRDVVKRYDIDAVHFDDYFYPYRIANRDFPDRSSYRMYGKNLGLDDWRRSNVDTIIQMLNTAIKAEKPWVKFGISPFGVWRSNDKDPDGTPTRGSLTNYDDLYADVIKWQRLGWIDYLAPQLYWEFGHRLVPFGLLVNWWGNHAYGRHIYIGHAPYRIGSNASWKDPGEIPRQIQATRALSTIQGSIYYSAKCFADNALGFVDSLRNHFYRYPALRPTMPWLDNKPPEPPYFTDAFEKPEGLEIRWADDDTSNQTKQFVVYRFEDKDVINVNDPTKILSIVMQMPDPVFIDRNYIKGRKYIYIVTALDRMQNESMISDPLRVEMVNGKAKFEFEP
ncbi:family 10 glycosylhydrolase [Chitinophaga sp. SYP-B3965]|uniref:glycoside hydrolase family 10 protein n=1 Tax=Chitinophaga sp. SYP-B3965 TaxID=2663120 RepID=UPI00129996E3|nr:family 10 glycosylhydrolase [Chitinophaga sp. SYP-B3965]MRG46468.1 family 10 glycosylhydrolase [Chitinophaga sp. SYP-B3965]